ncbi:hypothetical protein JTE90_022307 [Oedothorax gibbosus]|uniref:Uncharacterized protein n=1 Tax=Oedothorax gibbosus TaxID=931172 RepID=A0AAV6VVX2_9ARAC|nr:hypothetical protein JTE90_022307 [Oedothorax gibbosus]
MMNNIEPDETSADTPNSEVPDNKTLFNDNPDAKNENILQENKDNPKDEDSKNYNSDPDPMGDLKKDATTQWYENDGEYFSVGYFLKEDGTSEEVRLHISEAEDSDEEDIDYPYHHFAEDGSVEKVDPKQDSTKKAPEVLDDRNSISLGNFLRSDGTVEELRISFEELECDSEEKSEDLEGMSATYHYSEDGSLQTLLEERPSKKDASEIKNEVTEEAKDGDTFGDTQTSDESTKMNIAVSRNSPNVMVISEDKNETIEDKEAKDENTLGDPQPSDESDESSEMNIPVDSPNNMVISEDKENESNEFYRNDIILSER